MLFRFPAESNVIKLSVFPQLTHPDDATLVDPLCFAKRVKKIIEIES